MARIERDYRVKLERVARSDQIIVRVTRGTYDEQGDDYETDTTHAEITRVATADGLIALLHDLIDARVAPVVRATSIDTFDNAEIDVTWETPKKKKE